MDFFPLMFRTCKGAKDFHSLSPYKLPYLGPRKSSLKVTLEEKLTPFNYQLTVQTPAWQGVGQVHGIKR